MSLKVIWVLIGVATGPCTQEASLSVKPNRILPLVQVTLPSTARPTARVRLSSACATLPCARLSPPLQVNSPLAMLALLFASVINKAPVAPTSLYSAGSGPAGNVGAGAGATVGKILGMERAMKAGTGTSSEKIGDSLIVGALAAVNALGDVIDPENGKIIAGARAAQCGDADAETPGYFADALQVMKTMGMPPQAKFSSRQNTVIGVVATNAQLNKEQANKVAQMAQDGVARTIRPAHTMMDGDTIFALATGEVPADVNLVGACAAELFAQAILRAVYQAKSAGGLPGLAG